MSSSEIPQYSTQYNNVGGESDDPNQVQSSANHRERRQKWNPSEDIVLISAWLNTSKDPIVGNEQKADAFWKRIAVYYSRLPAISNMSKREWNNCKQRWQRINDGVSKFVGCYEYALSQRTSVQSEDDVVQVAYQLYYNDYKTNFTLEHAWRELRNYQKRCSSCISQSSNKVSENSKRTKLNEGGTYSSSSNPESPIHLDIEEQAMACPLGVKSSKRKGKKVATTNESSQSRLEKLWELKEKDMAGKKKLSKLELLTSLLAKTERLSEKEETLKNKLINEML